MTVLFWISALIAGYVYAGYPTLLAGWARIANRHPRRAPVAGDRWPSISIIGAARNEAARLPARIGNLLDQAYPGPREIIVVSDGSTDRTVDVVRGIDPAVRLIDLPP